MRKNLVFGFFLALIACSGTAAAEGGWAVAGKAGTLGFGVDLHRMLVPHILSFRTGVALFRYSTNLTDNDIDYAAKLKLGSVPIGLDLYPFKNWFRLAGGLMVNLNEVAATARAVSGTIKINGVKYTSSQLGQLDGVVKFNRASPYFGLGFGRTFKEGKHWGFTFDLGAMYHGQAKLTLSTSQAPSTQLQNDLRQQEQRFHNDAKDYTFWPIIQFGLSYRFGGVR
jgi:hypothetical protein